MHADDCALRNERIRIEISNGISDEMKAPVAKFFREIGAGHAFLEVIEPLTKSTRTLIAMGISDRPWPPRGVGAHIVEAMAIAVIGDGNRAFLTPVLVSPQNGTNVGLAAALTKRLFDALNQSSVKSMIYLVRDDSTVIAHLLSEAGFKPSNERVVTEQANFLHFAADPEEALKKLGLAERRAGDLLSLSLDPDQLSRLSLYHFGLSAASRNFWSDRIDLTVLLPGLIDWVATLPPGGIGGTPGPSILDSGPMEGGT